MGLNGEYAFVRPERKLTVLPW